MLEELVSLEELSHFMQTELEQKLDAILQLIAEGNGPVVIHDNKNRCFIMFSWSDYFSRFGWLYTKAEIDELEQACRKNEENTHDLLYK